MPGTAPLPLSRFQHQSSFHPIAMHGAQLLDALVLREHNEIIKSPPPAGAASFVAAHAKNDGPAQEEPFHSSLL